MNKNLLAQLLTIFFLCYLTVINSAKAATNIEDLINQGKLTVNLQVNQKQQYIVGQAVILAVEVSTDRWFATGSKIQHFTLKNVVMQANNIITINGSKRINGKSWATQTHEITLYPTASGIYHVAPIQIDISVNTEDDGVVTGVISTQERRFTIELPPALAGIDNFIVSSQVTLSIDGQFDEKKDYAVGEAITQTITITASDTPAMMIHPINLIARKNTELNTEQNANENNASQSDASEMTTSKSEAALTDVSGLSIYHKPAQIFDKSNRGSLLGTRVESYTYIFEKSGSYKIDGQVIYWWNSQENTLERLLIPSSTWTVSGGSFNQQVQSSLFNDFSLNVAAIITLLIIILLLTLSYLGFIKRQQLYNLYRKVTKQEQRLLRRSFLNAIAMKNYLGATQYLYQYTLLSDKQSLIDDCSFTVALNKLAFHECIADKTALKLSVNEAKALIKKIDITVAKKANTSSFYANKRINLNID
ncbi:BatD family protein [Colwellia psychrerythraea]|nr:BatD family protein [Colwellia psychrerythraea]